MNLTTKRIVVTGGTGFLGSHVVKHLKTLGCSEVFVPRSAQYDLRDKRAMERLFEDARPEVILHLAAVVGGIGANRQHPGQFFYDNAMMGLQIIEMARKKRVEKFLSVGTICSYPKFTAVPFKEEDIWSGYPEETNAPYGLAKKMLIVQAQAYRQEYGFNAVTILPTNLFGPGEHFDLETSHVIPALVRKCVEAKETGASQIVLWGDGSPTREFLYVDDAAEGIILAAQKYDSPEPINLGTGVETPIKDLATMIAKEVGFKGKIFWDTSKPNGQPRRCLDTSKAKELFGFTAKWKLSDGIRETVVWYLKNRPELSSKVG
jgi:GDP-L-fucose synthase